MSETSNLERDGGSRDLDRAVEEGLACRGRLRILKALADGEGALSVYRLRRITGLKREAVKRHLAVLVEHGWVRRVPFTGIDVYALNHDNPKARRLAELLKLKVDAR